jgi:thymidylate kinase
LLVVEVSGPAGAGKSTLTKALCGYDSNIQIGMYPYTRDVRNIPFFLYNMIPLSSLFFSFYRRGLTRKLTRNQQAVMAILQGWPRLLRKTHSKGGNIVILDQGPVYMFSDLLRFGPSNFRQIAGSWWDRTCHDWGNLLNIVVCLDAPDLVLLERVRCREKDHGFKRDTDAQAINFLERCRQTQDATLTCMCQNSKGPTVVCFDTSKASLADVAQSTLALLRRMENKIV